MNAVYLLLGSNLENRHEMLRLAVKKISDRIGPIRQSSSIYESEPWGFQAEKSFLNQVVRVETDFSPVELLSEILEIEKDLGRVRQHGEHGYASRTIDIDILFFNDEIIRSEYLNIPHPRISERLFTLVPLCELNRGFIHPVYQKSVQALLEECTDSNPVNLYRP